MDNSNNYTNSDKNFGINNEAEKRFKIKKIEKYEEMSKNKKS